MHNGVGEFCIGSKQYGFGCTTGQGNFVVRDAGSYPRTTGTLKPFFFFPYVLGGRGVCDDCSKARKQVPLRGWDEPVRVCDLCKNMELQLAVNS